MHVTLASPHLNIYHKSDSLIFQFIISEFISSYREILVIHRLSVEILEDPENVEGLLRECLEKLSGSAHTCMKVFSWNVEEGVLAKLKNYCAHFSKSRKLRETEDLHHFVHEAWLSCLQSIEMIQSSAFSLKALHKVLVRIVNYMRRFARITAKLMQKFRLDENLIFFMLNYHKQLDELYGQQFVFKQLSRMFGKGIEGASQFLKKKYAARGFDKLLPIIGIRIAEIEAAIA